MIGHGESGADTLDIDVLRERNRVKNGETQTDILTLEGLTKVG